MTQAEIEITVREAVCEALALDLDEATPEASLVAGLGAHPFEVLDVLAGIRRSTGVEIYASDLADHLDTVMPNNGGGGLEGRLAMSRAFDRFTVRNLADLVFQRAALAPV